MIVREKVERVVVENGSPVAVCDGCGKRVSVTDIDLDHAEHPKDWHLILTSTLRNKPTPYRWDPMGFCSWTCIANYAFGHPPTAIPA